MKTDDYLCKNLDRNIEVLEGLVLSGVGSPAERALRRDRLYAMYKRMQRDFGIRILPIAL